MALLDKLKWRYATKKFDTAKNIPADTLQTLLDAIQLAPSSYGLQHYRVLVIKDAETREKLKAAGYGQPQITDASQLIVFAAETNIDADFVKHYIDNVAQTRNVPRETLTGFENMLVGAVSSRTPEQALIWAQKQAYIGLGFLLAAAAEHGVDACPMEGFDAAGFNEILGLKEKGLTATVIATVGYRAQDDDLSHAAKVRRPAGEFFIHI
ncbi:NAD(P)H-dependent oxidoreductase [Mucilaginibacter phyllosphaerae]|uniref:NAD(P)H-dependent oxidoreductase n=1 Tax=Mucilaginibacter phyllosphaerae TaxID=1812349 RepID=A0A4Y8ACV6_9SPHI|nr:NAD(P)H-dependent oxidoreductase [Mucilaginibacter phyllosphaerae]MBB3970086.1 nitroreductase [Mucilaginibacter phyllosphaerae]TEW66477.1 NAD(P)H-dependent oxidoreductase [Mucilaginibacter phyllosphaerae]GGH09713.1 NAD(P)H-dependent oxidoreductase [Mucilaginibacter phyllosphaerae]